MATKITATRQVVEDYQRLFVNRRAYTMQSMRPHPETGRHYYFRPSNKGTDTPLMLTEGTTRQHMEGKITVGLYAINPSTQRCKWVAIDADYRNSMEDLLKLQYHLTQDGVELHNGFNHHLSKHRSVPLRAVRPFRVVLKAKRDQWRPPRLTQGASSALRVLICWQY